MEIKKFNRGDKLRATLLEMEVGDKVKIPFRLYSENTLRVTKAQIKRELGLDFEISTSATAATFTRLV